MSRIIQDAQTAEIGVPVISVALPVYNGERYLAEAIDSILAQTFSDFELIIVDDGSTDNSLQLLREYQERDSRIRLIARENRNLATTLNDIFTHARGKWIARMDQDDIALPQRFERQLQWLEQTGSDITGSGVKHFGTSDHRVIKHAQSDAAVRMEMLFGCPFAHPSVMMRAALAKQLPYDPAWERAEDYDLWERAARAGWKMTNVPEVLLNYRLHAAQTSKVTFDRQLELTQKIKFRYWEYVFNSLNLNKQWIIEILKIRNPSAPTPDMGMVDAAFTALLRSQQGEARETIFVHATRLYYLVAARCPDVARRWGRLNAEFGSKSGFATKLELWLMSTMRIRTNSRLFSKLKKIYVALLWRS